MGTYKKALVVKSARDFLLAVVKILLIISIDFCPLKRTTPRPDLPKGVEIAAMVSSGE